MSRVRSFDSLTRAYLTIPSEEYLPEESAWYLFLPIRGEVSDEQILTTLINYTARVQTPEEDLHCRYHANDYGGLWVEIVTPTRCTPSDVILRLFSGLRVLQDFVGHGEFPGGLALLQSPMFDEGDFEGENPNMVMLKKKEKK